MSAKNTESKLIQTGEAARLMGCGPDNVRRLVREGRIKCEVTAQGNYLFQVADIKRFLKERNNART